MHYQKLVEYMKKYIIPLIQRRVAYVHTHFWNNDIISSYVLQFFDPIEALQLLKNLRRNYRLG